MITSVFHRRSCADDIKKYLPMLAVYIVINYNTQNHHNNITGTRRQREIITKRTNTAHVFSTTNP